MNQAWKTIPLFISSTFRDMHAERDELNHVVFPALVERLKERRCRLEPIDLRLGVETESTQTERERERQILKVCLAEIERSRPFLLVLLGERYGWVPGRERIHAASQEAGYAPLDEDSSVTALEIEYGLLRKDPVQRRRCLLCLREPLDTEQMPESLAAVYSEACATDPGAPDRARRLATLKSRIRQDPELEGHRMSYAFDWDPEIQRPRQEGEGSVRAWGRAVEKALWDLLEEETAAHAAQAEPTWEDEERFAIEELVERLGTGFVGRGVLLRQATELAASAAVEGAPWGLCVTGASGSGKSALFARLHLELARQEEILLLSHAAGVSPRAGHVEWMLRRWIGELGAAMGDAPSQPEELRPEELEAAFRQWLHRAAATRRVVLLVDALNQFSGERARTPSWLPGIWPANARFLATAIPGAETEHLARRPGLDLVELPPLELYEASEVAVQVYGRYHRTPNAEVLGELLARHNPEGVPAAGNPLWLTMALDLLNQLDVDDFSAIEGGTGPAEERLRLFLRELARALPTDVAGLYRHLLARVERVAGRGESRALAALLALSRNGWREEDLHHLLPRATDLLVPEDAPHAWDALRFAVLRRCFRAHLVKHGALEQWDLAHATLCQTFLALLEGEWQVAAPAADGALLVRSLYTCGADYLETLPSDTGVATEELMWQMLGTRDALRVAQYFAQPTSRSTELALFLSEDEALVGHPLRSFVLTLLEVENPDLQAAVAHEFIFDLNDGLEVGGHLLLRRELLVGAANALARPVDSDPSTTAWQRDLSESQRRIGDVLQAQGDLVKAQAAYQEALVISRRLAEADPSNATWQRDLSVSQHTIGDVLRLQGDLAGARAAYQESLAIGRRLTEADPENSLLQHGLSASQDRIGNVQMAQGDLAGALTVFRESLVIYRRLTEVDPSNALWQSTLSMCQNKVGDVLQLQGVLAGALTVYMEALAIRRRLALADPENSHWQNDLSANQDRIGIVQMAQGDLAGALTACMEALAIRRRLTEADPSNAAWQGDLSVSQDRIGFMLRAQGDLGGAQTAFIEALAIRRRLAEADPSNATWQRDLSVSQINIGDVQMALGDLAGAMTAYREALGDPPSSGGGRSHQRRLAARPEREPGPDGRCAAGAS
ncbi:MAG: tetratricopeptide repeat protein [Prosthecobacter sp.]|nr:tetratricopeptide repeat protein [Prosthecobacter sp.]